MTIRHLTHTAVRTGSAQQLRQGADLDSARLVPRPRCTKTAVGPPRCTKTAGFGARCTKTAAFAPRCAAA